MAADVAERAQRSLLVAHHDDRFAGNFRGEITFRIGDGALRAVHFAAWLVERADQLPGAQKDPRLFDFQNGGIGIERRRQGVRAFDLFVDVEL